MLNFVDFWRVFDSVDIDSMWKFLEIYGIPRKLISLIPSMYDESKSCVRVGHDHTYWFTAATGVGQGVVLSPLFFNILLDFVLRKIDTIEREFE